MSPRVLPRQNIKSSTAFDTREWPFRRMGFCGFCWPLVPLPQLGKVRKRYQGNFSYRRLLDRPCGCKISAKSDSLNLSISSEVLP